MPEIWAECELCNRSFYCERSSIVDGKVHHCPVCGTPAATITTREPGGGQA